MMLNKVSIGVVADMLEAIIAPAFQSGTVPQNIMIQGSPGMGKSANVYEAAEKIGKIIGKPVEVIDVRLGTMESSEVQGIPYNAESDDYDILELSNGEVIHRFRKTMQTSTPAWFPTDPDKFYILFLDELTNASVSVQQAAYRLILDRSVQNGATLPASCAIIAAGNLREDKTGAKPLVPALANRFGLHLIVDIHQSADDIINHAISAGWSRSIIGFLSYKKESIYVNSGNEDAFATPRSWSYVNEHLKNDMLAAKSGLLDIAIAGAIGTATATEFAGYREYEDKIPSWKDIRSGKVDYKVPQGDESLKFAITTALSFEIVDAMRNGKDDEIYNLMKVTQQLPKEMSPVLVRTISGADKSIAAKFIHHKHCKEWFRGISDQVSAMRRK